MSNFYLEDLAREYNEAASYAEHHPHDEEAWNKSHRAYKTWIKAEKENKSKPKYYY